MTNSKQIHGKFTTKPGENFVFCQSGNPVLSTVHLCDSAGVMAYSVEAKARKIKEIGQTSENIFAFASDFTWCESGTRTTTETMVLVHVLSDSLGPV